ncbi:MAG: D-amino acid aminotransferase [Hyphomicrobiales bacterium]|nr:D-amino-acid transaminase [Hyphomicrobiales bacterium]PCJ86018.1 MAG: D-amino acid aminotransferase [Hyphomicrobiales bacterium]
MGRISYVNGRYVDHCRASVHIEDRGYQFADGIYEVIEVLAGKLVDESRHVTRLARSLSELQIAKLMTDHCIGIICREIIARNKLINGFVYLQITRGVAPRNHLFPTGNTKPAFVVTATSVNPEKSENTAKIGVAVVSLPDNRWDRVDIKSTSLLPNVLAKQFAKDNGAAEAWFVDSAGYVTEGSSTNAWIVSKDGVLITRPAKLGILRGITRETVIDLAAREGLKVEERAFTVEEAQNAREAFITAATTLVMPVVTIDGQTVANGSPGSIALNLREQFHTQSKLT